jgi:hypothetical protein
MIEDGILIWLMVGLATSVYQADNKTWRLYDYLNCIVVWPAFLFVWLVGLYMKFKTRKK